MSQTLIHTRISVLILFYSLCGAAGLIQKAVGGSSRQAGIWRLCRSACDDGFRIDWHDWLEWLCALIMEAPLVVFIERVEGGSAVNGE